MLIEQVDTYGSVATEKKKITHKKKLGKLSKFIMRLSCVGVVVGGGDVMASDPVTPSQLCSILNL